MSRFVAALAVAAVSVVVATPAFADCAETGANVFACSGIDTNGLTAPSDVAGVTVNVLGGASVTNGGDAIRARGDGAKVTNIGTVASTGSDAIDGGDGLSVTNVGLLSGAKGVNAGVGVTVTNSSAIEATDKAVDLGNGATVTNYGTITAGNEAIETGDGAAILNYGTLTATEKTLDLGDGATVTNYGTITSVESEGIEAEDGVTLTNWGSIFGFDDAVQVGENAKIVNHGVIENVGGSADPQDALDIDSGIVTNMASGVIRSTFDAAIDFDGSDIASTITNHGLISGTTGVLVEKGTPEDAPNIAAQTIINHGTIVGTAGLALDLGEGADLLEMHAGASLIGGADFGQDDDRLSFFDDFIGLVGGAGAVLDGGEGFDLVTFATVGLADVTAYSFIDDVLSLSFKTAVSDFTVALRSWEVFEFGDRRYTQAEVIAAVPLPAGAALLVPALGLLGWVGRRRRA